MEDELCLSSSTSGVLTEWRVAQGQRVTKGTPLCRYKIGDQIKELKSPYVGHVVDVLVNEETDVEANVPVVRLQSGCDHSVVAFDMCAHCGANLRKHSGKADLLESNTTAHFAVVHTVPQLKVSKTEARQIAGRDEGRLLQQRKLVLIVDLDQTLIHTTVDPSVEPGLKDVYGFQLPGYPHFYHCRLRPGAKDFVSNISAKYEMHVFTMGGREYAHTVAGILDPDEKLFGRRVLSRDELVDQNLKASNLRALFPIDDSMLVIIDDREDVWASIPNLILVKPYRFFKDVGDIHSPSGKSSESEEACSQGNTNKSQGMTGEVTDKEIKEKSQEPDLGKSTKQTKTEIHQKCASENTGNNDAEKAVVKDKQDDDDKSSHSSLSRSSSNESVSSSSDSALQKDELQRQMTETDDKNKQVEQVIVKSTGTDDAAYTGNVSVHSPGRRTSHVLSKAMLALEESDNDNYLLYLGQILNHIHASFYEQFDQMSDGSPYPDLREIITHMKRNVLRGASIVFSSVFPTNITRPEEQLIWQTATALGAVVSTTLVLNDHSTGNPPKKKKTEQVVTTHVVAAKRDTHKAYQAQKMRGIYLVSPDWLWCCAERWEWVDEKLFPVDDLPVAVDLDDERLARPAKREKDRTEENGVGSMKRIERLFSDEEFAEMDREVNEALGSDDSSNEDDEPKDRADDESGDSSCNDESGQSSSEDQMAALLDEEIAHF
ncbi:RNA polymerase II subunit A C-terminal domain phosphatase-like isoform X2 [Corticium candelabrum]|uniref:RNA polymerase II subunit A C-terminal domain phosphatase-like isoform X2 n=1 Tax=Corticium candelabrum TaxID=121492 RepID=UPI002E26C7DE|nr:RNA polymerase II subunit A C-terminal domain phosphatase-like isoform X2 [Corticium candelabrum]